MKVALLIGVGGFLGAIARWGLNAAVERWWPAAKLPAGIITVNVLGCLAIGVVFGLIAAKDVINEAWRLLLITGFLGSFTTFSTFGWQTIDLVQRGHSAAALANVLVSVIVGIGAVWLGYSVMRWVLG